MNCHICHKPMTDSSIEKCKLCCDGFEQEFCRECASNYRIFRTKFDTPIGNAAFKKLRSAREKGVA